MSASATGSRAAPRVEPAYPDYAPEEKFADGIVHVIGVVGSIVGFLSVYAYALSLLSMPTNVALIVYGLTVVGLFSFSAAYHLTPWPELRPALRRFDQAAIFLKIAGSYTPVVFLIDTAFGYVMLAMIWSAALMGAAGKLFAGGALDRYTVTIYLGLGWASLLLVWPMFTVIPYAYAWLIVAGGIVYSVGVIFHQWEGLKYQNALWHLFVLSASALHFFAITGASFAVGSG